ncbi:MAG: S-layer homology domain-containing protein [Lachnospiraceae bacterium]|nr:S-layer homology domain-containing protein [Lachnospiraceae bacterium]
MNLMKKYKNRVLSFVLALTMVFSSITVVSANTSDISGHWGEAVLQKWIDLGMLNGYANNQYKPNGSITRAEFVTLLNKMNNNTQTSDEISKYTDVKPTDWYYNEISKALAAGYISGTSSTTVSPTKLITREEAAAIVVKSKGIAPSSQESILSLANDGNTASSWAKPFMAAAIEQGYISGSNGNVYPTNNLTRAEGIALLDKILTDTRTFSFPATYGSETETMTVSNVIVNNPDITLCNMTINGDLEITEAVGDGDVTLENVSIKGNAYVKGGGEHTVLFNNVDVAGALVVNKLDGKIRILATGNTNISVTTLSSGAILVERELTGGGFETVTIPAEIAANQSVVIEGNVDRFENQAEGLNLTVNGTVKELTSSHSLKVGGEANILKTTPSEGAQITSDKASSTPNANTAGGGGSSDSGSSNSGSSNNDSSDDSSSSKKKNVSSVQINESDTTLNIGETKTFTATVLPSYARDKSIQWSSSNTAVATVDANGMVSAVSAGTAVITVTTVNGGKTDFVPITVKKPRLTLELNLLTQAKGENLNEINNSEELINQSVYFDYKEMLPFAVGNRYYSAYVQDINFVTSNTFLPVIVTVKDNEGTIAPTNGTEVHLNSSGDASQVYGFGQYLADGHNEGSFLVLLDTSQKVYTLSVTDDRYEGVYNHIYIVPSDKPLLDKVGDITGKLEEGETLTVGDVKADGSIIDSNITYQWFVTNNSGKGFKNIVGAESNTYTIPQGDAGKFFKVEVYGDNENAFGVAVTNSYGPVAQSVDMQEIIAEIGNLFLGQNTDANYVNKDLNLMTSLANYPNVSIAWSSDNGAVNAQTGVITRGEDDVTVKLTATINGTTSQEFEVKILSNKVTNVGQTGIDLRFAPGYPRAFVKDGTINVEFKTVSPAKVYMLINSINGHMEDSKAGVLGGYGGEENQLIHVDSWPYFETEANQLISFDTERSVTSGHRDKRIEFVLEDINGGNVGDLVTILFDKETLAALDETGPECEEVKINRDNSKAYVYFDEGITATGLSATDFSLSKGTVTGVVDVKNFDRDSCVVLSVSGADTTSLLNYTGSAIKDKSINANLAPTFSSQKITSANTVITDVIVGNDGKSVMVEVTGGEHNYDSDCVEIEKDDFTMVTANGGKKPRRAGFSYNFNHISYELRFDETLVLDSNSKMIINMNKPGVFDYAYDTYSSPIEKEVTNNLSGINDKTPLSVTYNKASGQFDLTFDSQLDFSGADFADNFVVKIGGTEYRLRGQLLRDSGNTVTINLLEDKHDNYSKKIKDILSTASSVEIKYELIHEQSSNQLLDIGAALLPAFGYETVTMN